MDMETEAKRVKESLNRKFAELKEARGYKTFFLDLVDYLECVDSEPILNAAKEELLQELDRDCKRFFGLRYSTKKAPMAPIRQLEEFVNQIIKARSCGRRDKPVPLLEFRRFSFYSRRVDKRSSRVDHLSLVARESVAWVTVRLAEVSLLVRAPEEDFSEYLALVVIDGREELKKAKRRLANWQKLLDGRAGDDEVEKSCPGFFDRRKWEQHARKLHNYLLDHLSKLGVRGKVLIVGRIHFRPKDGWFKVGDGKEESVTGQSYRLLCALMEAMEPRDSMGLEKGEGWKETFRGVKENKTPEEWERELQGALSNLRKTMKIEGKRLIYTEGDYIKIKR